MTWRMNAKKTAEAMLRAGIDTKTLAKTIGHAERAVGKAVKGQTFPRIATITAIAKALNADPVELCDNVENEEKRGRKSKRRPEGTGSEETDSEETGPKWVLPWGTIPKGVHPVKRMSKEYLPKEHLLTDDELPF